MSVILTHNRWIVILIALPLKLKKGIIMSFQTPEFTEIQISPYGGNTCSSDGEGSNTCNKEA